MDKLKKLFDYQRFAKKDHLQSKIDDVYNRYFAKGKELSDDELNISAAGNSYDFLSDDSGRNKK